VRWPNVGDEKTFGISALKVSANAPANNAESSFAPGVAGIGLRAPHYQAVLAQQPALAFLEVHSENFFGEGGQSLRYLDRVREDYDISLHGVGMSLGSTDSLNATHLQKLKRLVDRVEPCFVSEHLCWVGVNGRFLNDLLPLPYTKASLDLVVSHVDQLQQYLGRKVMVENVSSYLEFTASDIPEWEFVNAVADQSGCGVLLDVNNIYVNSKNHGFDPLIYLNAINPQHVGEIHLAGFEDTGEILIDTHSAPVFADVWPLYEHALKRFGAVPTLIEWDTDIPALDVLLAEAAKANGVAAKLAHHELVEK
jgi:uncharacterized protein